MISRQHRFHGLNSLRTVYKYGQTVRNPQIALKYNLNPKRQTYRCAVVVAKKVEKSAVKRNRIRRRVFEIVRSVEPAITQPYDLVFSIYSADVVDMPFTKVETSIKQLLKNASVLDSVK